ncbi:MAG: hypothetical protein BMS9Abin12_1754 [Acidimicrobiia bacterium]|nr:MAG: hypothetical protein BMS9Abin12_1754 [Acidimicrobiia bacterium]
MLRAPRPPFSLNPNLVWCLFNQVVDGQVAILSCVLEPHVPILPLGYPSRTRRYPEALQDAVVSEEVHTRDRSCCAIHIGPIFRSSELRYPSFGSVCAEERDVERSAYCTAAGPSGPEAKAEEAEDRRPSRLSPETWRLHARVHRYTEEAELGPSQGCANSPFVWSGNHRVHSR